MEEGLGKPYDRKALFRKLLSSFGALMCYNRKKLERIGASAMVSTQAEERWNTFFLDDCAHFVSYLPQRLDPNLIRKKV
jgi:hypothetical protein